MSPPAQNAFVLVLASTTADSGVSAHSASSRSMAATMSVVRALSALGRFSRMRPTPRWTSARISAAAVSVMGQHLVVRADLAVVAIMFLFLMRRVSGVDLRVEILDLVHGGYDGVVGGRPGRERLLGHEGRQAEPLVLVDAVGLRGGHVKILTQ